MKSGLRMGMGAMLVLGSFAPQVRGQVEQNGVIRVPVVFSGGHDTDPRDGGRPVVLIASALEVPTDVFREAFSHVRPAPAGAEPDPRQVNANKDALLRRLSKYGVTNDRLDAVSNYYRYVRNRGQLWPAKAAVANALVKNGVVVGYEIVSGGAGYTSVPMVRVPNVTSAPPSVKLQFTKVTNTNGSIAQITVPATQTKRYLAAGWPPSPLPPLPLRWE